MVRVIDMTCDDRIVIELSGPRVQDGCAVRGKRNRLIRPLARGTATSPEQEACGGVDHVVVNIDRAGTRVGVIGARTVDRWTRAKAKIVVKLDLVQVAS